MATSGHRYHMQACSSLTDLCEMRIRSLPDASLPQLVDAARGIVYLHSMKPPTIHRDIKSPNLVRLLVLGCCVHAP